jgi:DNA end-binding protein Ku
MANGSRGRQRKRHDDANGNGAARPRAFWSGTISFGLVSIPVELYPANRHGRPGLRMLAPSGLPVQRRYACSREDVIVPPEHLVRGYEIKKDEYVVVTDEELAALAPEKSRDIDLQRFVPVEEVDPVLFERAYFLAPGGQSAKAYRLLAEVMETSARAGIATFVMRDKEYFVAILAEGGILRAETLRFADEVRSAEDVGLPEPRQPKAAAVKALQRTIAARAAKELDADELVDPWSGELTKLAEKKRRQGEDVVEVPEAAAEEELAEVIDLMEVLKRSLGARASGGAAGGGRRPATRGARSRRPAQRKPATGGPRRRSSAGAAKAGGKRRRTKGGRGG